jgi:hypothetical protein
VRLGYELLRAPACRRSGSSAVNANRRHDLIYKNYYHIGVLHRRPRGWSCGRHDALRPRKTVSVSAAARMAAQDQ